MATKKPTPKTPKITTPANTFEAELDLAINDVCASAPELKEVIACELTALRERILTAHKLYIGQNTSAKAEELDKAYQVINLMEQDMNSLKTTILRMAVSQYSN